MHEWLVFLEGPAGTPFENGIFVLDVLLPENYPFVPPRITFSTPIFHCNVSVNGSICLDALQHQWSPALVVAHCLHLIAKMLQNPDSDNALRPAIAELYFGNRQDALDTRYVDQARAATRAEASKSLEELRALYGIHDREDIIESRGNTC